MNTTTTFEGVYSLGKNGIAYITNQDTGDVIEIPPHLHRSALHKDIVRVRITNKDKKEGEITDIIQRAQAGFAGILKQQGAHFVVHPDNFKIPEITVPTQYVNGGQVGEQVFVEIVEYAPQLIGKVIKNLGKPDSNDAHMKSIALEQGFDYAFPPAVEHEAEALESSGINEHEITTRKDMRGTLTFTIDPADAKDFDDALSFKVLDNGHYEIGIHIADVSHYVTPGSALDQEAQKRTTSVYLVDRTIPMLPEALSNGLCSIRPNEDKLAFSALFEIDPQNGKVMNEWFGRTIIHSDKRYTYEEAQDIIDNGNGLYVRELTELNRLAKIYEEERYKKGALNFETREVQFILDTDGAPVSVRVKERIDTNKLIEEFMLLANNRVATFMKKAPFFVYRVHARPELDRMEKLQAFLKLLDYNTQLVDGIIPVKELQRIIREAEGKPVYDTLQTVIVRSMQKAVYTTNNIGHFGLAFEHYTHFTSPIRRYPDVLAHRLLHATLEGLPFDQGQEWYEQLCGHSSEQEQKAVTAERNSIKLKQVEYMNKQQHDTVFEGIVTGAGRFGVFVAEAESLSEGMIRLFDLGNDMWEYHEKTGIIIGKKTKKTFKIGDPVHIKIKQVDLEKRLIDYVLVIDGISQAAPSPRSPRKERRRHQSERRVRKQ
ncbi:ribonuclease R [Patescibacteria group bacterium]|nr:ribonuclease R [Patescibacteria group bacterium]